MTASAPTVQSSPITNSDNPLHKYRTYSYQFVLVACQSTDIIDAMQSNADPSIFTRQGSNQGNPQDKRVVQQYPGIQNGNYIIVIDSRVDMDFILEDVSWGTTFIGHGTSSKSSAANSAIVTDGELTIFEPRGVEFLNVLANLTNQLDTDPIAMPFALKVFFIGHNEDGTVDFITDVRPFAFIPVDIDANVDSSGSRYKFTICGTSNGISNTVGYDAIVDGVTLQITPGQTLDTIFKTLTNQVNSRYKAERTALQTLMTKTGVDISKMAQVVYSVVLNPTASSAPPGAGKIHTITDWGSNDAVQWSDGAGGQFIKGTKEGGFSEIINKIFKSSPSWMAIAVASNAPQVDEFNQTTSVKYNYKLSTEFKKSGNTCYVNIEIDEFQYEAVVVNDSNQNGKVNKPASPPTPSDVLTYDYIFTGKNVDIKDMNINLNMGLALYQTLSMAKSIPSQGQDINGGSPVLNASGPAQATNLSTPINVKGIIHSGTPLFAPLSWIDQYKQSINAVTTASSDAVWRNFAGYQSINSAITIFGNPILLGQISYPDQSVPTYVKINIRMPQSQDDIWEYQQSNNKKPGGLYQTFWFDGLYLILTAVNKFKDGEFSQELELVSQPETSSTAANIASQQDKANNSLTTLNSSLTTISTSVSTAGEQATQRFIAPAAAAQKKPRTTTPQVAPGATNTPLPITVNGVQVPAGFENVTNGI